MRLLALEPHEAPPLADPESFHHLPGGEARRSDVADLALGGQIVERPQGLLDRHHGVRAVQLEQVDPVRAESAQRCLDGADQMTPGVPPVVRGLRGGEVCLGCENDPVPSIAERLTEHFLAGAGTIHVCRVHEVDAGVERAVHDPHRGRPIRRGAQVHAAQAQRRDLQTRPTQAPEDHGRSSSRASATASPLCQAPSTRGPPHQSPQT